LSQDDRDLNSIQEARHLIEQASEAQRKFAAFSQAQVDAVVDACAAAATSAAEHLARMAVEETGFGNVPDKILKNRHASVELCRAIRGMKTVGVLRQDGDKGIWEIASPVGVVAAIIPSTNPTSTAIYKTLIALKAQNAIVLSPHPAAIRCICEAVSILSRAASEAGAPDGLIGCFHHPTPAKTQEMMRHPAVGVILATGGVGLVRAAYSSGKPAYGVGPGNVPAFIERTANIAKAVADISAGKTFDYGTICSSEQSIVTEDAVCEQVLEECRQQDGHFLSPGEIRKLGELVFRPGSHAPNPKIVGRPATMIADMAGLTVPASTRVLIARLDGVGREYPLSAEKLSPILAFYSTPDFQGGIDLCTRLLRFGGLGHTIAIHSRDDAAILRFGEAVPAFRVCVNTSAVHGSIGYSTNLFPAMTLGCGSPGGNITSDNIGPQHLINIKRIARESRSVAHRTIPVEKRMITEDSVEGSNEAMTEDSHGPATIGADAVPDRETISRVVERQLAVRQNTSVGDSAAETCLVMKTNAGSAKSSAWPSVADVSRAAVDAVFAAKRVSRSMPESGLQSELPEKAAEIQIDVTEFVSECEVRAALLHNRKIYIGPKTILTPAARDLGASHDVFIDALSDSSPQSAISGRLGY
jgi:acetaldehyde dehydrogenase (acetylating)